MADRKTAERIEHLYARQNGLRIQIQQLNRALQARRLSVRFDFVTPGYVGNHDIPLTDETLQHVGVLVQQQLLQALDEIEGEISNLGFEP